MRYVAIDKATDGMIVAKTVYNNAGNILISKGVTLKDTSISSIKRMGYNGIYIEDDISHNIYVEDIVNDGLRLDTMLALKSLFTSVEERNDKTAKGKIREVQSLIVDIVDQVISKRSAQIQYMDIKTESDYIYEHCVNTAVVSCLVGTAMDMNQDSLVKLTYAAALHDIGQMFVDKRLLRKNQRLTPDEFEQVKKHTILGADYLKNVCFESDDITVSVLQHHEKISGEGYPHNKVGNGISRNAKIISISDVFDAVTSSRPYHSQALPHKAAIYMLENIGDHFELSIVKAFLRKVAIYPLGTIVVLNNNITGIVSETYPDSAFRPCIRVLSNGKPTDEYINLLVDSNAKSLEIVSVLG